MSRLCIIPARGGSKRIPRKNIRDFLGKPIIAYSIEVALESGLFDEVMVSTDDDEIAEVAKKYGAEVPFTRTPENSDDHAGTNEVLSEVLTQYKIEFDLEFDHGCCIYPTSPMITIEKLKDGYQKLLDSGANTVMAAVKYGYPIWRSFTQTETGFVKLLWPEHKLTRSQDMAPVFHDSGQWYWFDVKKFLTAPAPFENAVFIEVDELESQDIDTHMDWKMAELKFSLRNKP